MYNKIKTWFKGLVIGVCILLLPTSLLAGEKWDTTEKALVGSFIAGQIINYGQVNKTLNDPYWSEINPLMPAENTAELLVWKTGTTAALIFLADRFPIYRKALLVGASIVVWGFVAHDVSVGVGFQFSF